MLFCKLFLSPVASNILFCGSEGLIPAIFFCSLFEGFNHSLRLLDYKEESGKCEEMDRDVRRGRCFGCNEERKLELRLGPLGKDWLEIKEENENDHVLNPVLSLNLFAIAVSEKDMSKDEDSEFLNSILKRAGWAT